MSDTRLIVDLIRKASRMGGYPNLNPPERVRVGDYGSINKERGSFDKEGNIYDPSFAPDLNMLKNYPPTPCDPEDEMIIVTKGGRDAGAGTEAFANLGVASASVKGRWKFRKGRGAVLVMIKPTFTCIPADVLRPKLQFHPLLADKALVTGVWSCPTYALVMTNGSEAEVSFAWSVTEVTGTVGTRAFGKWATHSTSGVWRCAGGEDPNSTFFPLFRLETPKTRKFMDIWKNYRTSPVPTPEGDNTFRYHVPSWGRLDEDGNEVSIDDEVSSNEE